MPGRDTPIAWDEKLARDLVIQELEVARSQQIDGGKGLPSVRVVRNLEQLVDRNPDSWTAERQGMRKIVDDAGWRSLPGLMHGT